MPTASTPHTPSKSKAKAVKPAAPAGGIRARAQASKPVDKTPFRGEQERRRKQLLERIILASTVAFCFILIFSVWWTRGRVLDSSVRFLAKFAGVDAQSPREAAMNCRHPKNINTPYCIEHEAKVEESWRSMNRNQGGKTNAFSLHGSGGK